MSKSWIVLGASLAAGGAVAEELPVIEVEGQAIPLAAESVLVESDEVAAPSVDGGDFLKNLTGVSGSRFGGHGIDPVIRGQGQNRLNVLLDGAYIHGGCPSRMDPPTSYVAMESYDSVTVLKGNQTVLYGGGGSGGTVLFDRDTPRFAEAEAPRAKLGAGYRSNGAQSDAFIDTAAGAPQGFVRAVLGVKKGDNYVDGDGNEINSAYNEKSGSVILGYTPSDDRRLELSVEAVRGRDIHYVGSMDSPISDSDNLRLNYESPAWNAEVYRSDVHHVMDNYSLRSGIAPMSQSEVPSDSVTTGGRLSHNFEAVGNHWTVGIDDQSNNREAIRYSAMSSAVQALIWPDVDIKQRGLFVEIERPHMSATVSAGLRYDRVEAQAHKADVAPDVAMMGMPMTANQLYNSAYGVTADTHTENNVGGFVRYERMVNPQDSWFVGLSRSLRTADATERYIAAGMMRVGRPDLAPEVHNQLDLGVAFNRGDWQLAASAYYNRVNDYILSYLISTMAGDQERFANIDATLYGFELDGKRKLGSAWQLGMGLAYVHGQDDSNDLPLAQMPPLEATLNLDYQYNAALSVGGRVRAASNQDRVRLLADGGQDLQKTPGYAVFDLYSDWQLKPGAKLSLGVDNVFDLTYAEHLGREDTLAGSPVPISVNEPGRSVWLKAVVDF